MTKYYSGPERFHAGLSYTNGTPIAGAELNFNVNDVNYSRITDEHGDASIAINLNSGKHVIKVSCDEYGISNENRISISPTIYANDITKIFRNSTQYLALFLDSSGKSLKNTTVSFNINGVFYNRTTNDNGWAKLNLNLEEGEYILTAINSVTGEKRANTINIVSLISANDLTKYYRSDSQFIVRIHTLDGGWAGAGENVTFNIHGMIYNRSTNETGHVRLNINIEPGTYSITTYYGDCRKGNVIKVYPVLYANDISIKYGSHSNFPVMLVNGQGRAFSNQRVSFNIHGVLYDRMTDEHGFARLNINLQPGKYIITSAYESARLSNTILVTP